MRALWKGQHIQRAPTLLDDCVQIVLSPLGVGPSQSCPCFNFAVNVINVPFSRACRGIFITGSSLVGAAIRVPRITSKNLISVIFCEAVAIYGVIVAIILQVGLDAWGRWFAPRRRVDGERRPRIWNQPLCLLNLQTKIEYVAPENGVFDKYALAAGYAIFGSGITCGFANLVCG